MKLEIAPFYVDLIMEEVLGMMAYPAEQKGIELIAGIEPDTALSVLGDVHRVRQVLVNLMSVRIALRSKQYISFQVLISMLRMR